MLGTDRVLVNHFQDIKYNEINMNICEAAQPHFWQGDPQRDVDRLRAM